jgi:tetratricopeptide (TPR) repeat protein
LVHSSMRNQAQGFEYQLRILDQLEKEQQPHDAFFEAKVYNDNGLHYLDLDRTDDAIEMFQHALSITKVFQSPDQLSSMYWETSRYLAETQHFFLAKLYSHKTLELLYQEYSDSLRSEIYHYLGQAMLRQEQQNTFTNLEELLQNTELKKDTLALASVTATTAVALFQMGEVKKAYEYAQSACKLALPYGDSIVTASIFITLGRIAYARKDYKEGDTHFAEGLGILERLGTGEELSDQAAHYAQLLEERKMPNEALRYYKKAYENSRKHE